MRIFKKALSRTWGGSYQKIFLKISLLRHVDCLSALNKKKGRYLDHHLPLRADHGLIDDAPDI